MVTKARIASVAGEVNFTDFEYDFRNRMTKVTQYSKAPSEGGIILREESYRYDALGRRIEVISDGESTISSYDGAGFMANEWVRFNAAREVVHRFLFTDTVDQLVAQWTASESLAWAIPDHLGTIRDLVNNAGQSVQHIGYTAFGQPTFAGPVESTGPYAYTVRDGPPFLGFRSIGLGSWMCKWGDGKRWTLSVSMAVISISLDMPTIQP